MRDSYRSNRLSISRDISRRPPVTGTYFQAAFRVQSPWSIKNPNGGNPHEEEILKPVCFVFDFAPTRALRQLSEYGIGLSPNEPNQAVFAFRRYEDASLRYTGIESHPGLTHYGLYDTVVARE